MTTLISYIAPAAPATRRPITKALPYLRPEIGFTPTWYRQFLDIDFGARYHNDMSYRIQCQRQMRDVLHRKFPDMSIGQGITREDEVDGITGIYGACTIAAIYGMEIVYSPDNWPTCTKSCLSEQQIDYLRAPDILKNAHYQKLIEQITASRRLKGVRSGFVNLQGVLNNAQRLRGQNLFMDMLLAPRRVHHLMECVTKTMIEVGERLQEISAYELYFFTVSNCLVNMISPEQYCQFVQPYDRQIAETFGCLGIHNCAWAATPYLDAYAEIPFVDYIDMGLDSDLSKAKRLFSASRRALMYTPMDLQNKSMDKLKRDFSRIAKDYGPCDLVIADIEAGTPDERIIKVFECCGNISRTYSSRCVE